MIAVAGAWLVVQQQLVGRRAVVACAVLALAAAVLTVPESAAGSPSTPAPASPAAPAAFAPAPAGVRDPAALARAHLRATGAAFGLDRAAVAGLRLLGVTPTAAGGDAVRFRQTIGGVPVLAGELVAVLDGAGAVRSVVGETSRSVRATAYDVRGSRAARIAERATARARRLPLSAVRAARPGRWLYDASLVEPHGAPGARAVWRVEVTSPRHLEVNELVLVDAATGAVTARIGQVAGLDRAICDNAEVPNGHYDCHPGYYDRVEGSPSSGTVDIDQVYDLTGVTSDWFATRLGVDLTALIGNDDTDGRKLRSTTRYCPAWGCPLDNAFWSGNQMVYGAGYTSADDVIAHELAHGVTQHTAGLIYWFQSGAINESMSDVFGELVDLADGVGNDAPEVRWQLGEDLSARAGGLARDMKNPPRLGQPDTTGSDLYDTAPAYDDNGGVHTNSGVPNKSAYLVADGTAAEPGGVFNGQAFPGIGLEKTGVLYWSALQMLTPGSDFVDLAAALQQSCATLAAAATAGFTSADCNSVGAATIATGLTAWTGPSEPRDVRMSPVRRSVRVAWRAPASHGSSPVTSYAVHVRPPIGEDDFFPIEATSRSYQLPDLSPGVDYTIGLVAVTADGTSPSVVRRFAGTALQVRWPQSVPYATRSVLRGSLTGAGRAPAAGRVVRLLERQDGRPTTYRPVASTTTAADGTFALRLTQRRGETLQVSYAGSAGELGALSRTHRVSVRVRVGLVADFPRAGTAGVARFTGSVTPAVAGSPVRLQRRVGAGPWRTAARDRLATNGRYRLAGRTTPGRAETWRVVVVPRAGERFGGSGRLVGGSSRVVAPPS